MPRVSTKLLLIIVLVVAGFAATLALVVGQMREVAIGGPLYADLHRHAQLRQTLTLLRANLAEIRTLTTTARHTSEPEKLRTLAASAGALQNQAHDQLQRVLAATYDPAATTAVGAAKIAWDDFATTASATFDLMLRGDTRGLAEAVEKQAFRQERFTDGSTAPSTPSPSGTRISRRRAARTWRAISGRSRSPGPGSPSWSWR